MSARFDRVEVFTSFSVVKYRTLAYHWSYISRNGRILADGAQGYSRRIDALRGASRVVGIQLAPTPDFVQDIDGQERQVWEVRR